MMIDQLSGFTLFYFSVRFFLMLKIAYDVNVLAMAEHS